MPQRSGHLWKPTRNSKNAENRTIRSISWMVFIRSITTFQSMAGSKKDRPGIAQYYGATTIESERSGQSPDLAGGDPNR
jgi:hypothetical protein